MLPAFRVRQVRAIDSKGRILDGPAGSIQNLKTREVDGVILISKEEYDSLMTVTPEAALRYVDVDDGDVIQVGSSFELDQRLKEPSDGGFLITSPALKQKAPEHCFSVDRSKEVVEIWRQLDLKNLPKPSKSPNLASILNPQADPRDEYFWSTDPPQVGKETPHRKPMEKGKGKAPSTPKLPSSGEHERRWASYSSLPSSFGEVFPLPTYAMAKDDEPSLYGLDPGQGFMPSLSVDSAREENTSGPADSKSESKETPYQPLLDMFESQLSRLASSSPALVPTSANPSQNAAEGSTDKTAESECKPVPTELINIPGETMDGPSSDLIQTPGELLAHSLKSLLSGVSMIASSLKVRNTEIQQQIAIAQQEFPNNLDKAIRAGLAALDSLRSAIPVPPSPVVNTTEEKAADSDPSKDETTNEAEITAQPSKDVKFVLPSSTAPAEEYSASKQSLSGVKSSNAAVFEAERIISRRWIYYGGLDGPLYKQYLVRWAGKGPEHDTWYDIENLTDCGALIEEYERENPESKRSAEGRAKGTYIGFSPERLAFGSKCEAIHSRTAGNRMVTHGGSHCPSMQASNPPPPRFAASHNAGPRNRQSQILGSKRSEPILGDLRNARCKLPNRSRSTLESAYAPPPPMFGELRSSEKPANEYAGERRYNLRRTNTPGAVVEPTTGEKIDIPTQSNSGPPQDSAPPVNRPPRRLRHRQSWHPASSTTQNDKETSFGFPYANITEPNPPPMTQLRGAGLPRRMHRSLRNQASSSEVTGPTLWQASTFADKVRGHTSLSPFWTSSDAQEAATLATKNHSNGSTTKTNPFPTTTNPQPDQQSTDPPSYEPPTSTPDEQSQHQHQPQRGANASGSQHRARRMVPFAERKHACVKKLIEMGFTRADAEAAAACTGGNVEKAIEMFEEDEAAWSAAKSAWASARQEREKRDPLPGSWDDELYG